MLNKEHFTVTIEDELSKDDTTVLKAEITPVYYHAFDSRSHLLHSREYIANTLKRRLYEMLMKDLQEMVNDIRITVLRCSDDDYLIGKVQELANLVSWDDDN